MQIYQGIDIVEMGKFRAVFGGRAELLSEIFTDREREYCHSRRDPLLHLAARFACKEAVIKALDIGFWGFGTGHLFQEIEVVSRGSGKPGLSFHGWAAKIYARRAVTQAAVSISHAGNYCAAGVILIGE